MAFNKNVLFFILSLLIFAGCNRSGKSKEGLLQGQIKIDGSSTVYPITEAVAEEFRRDQPDVRITVGVSGTGGGFKKFSRGEIDISNASRSIKQSEIDACKANKIEFIELPVAFDGLAVVVNPKNTWVDYLTVEELKKMWEPDAQNVINNWSQIREGWPDEPINLYGAGTASGTYDYFTEAIVGKSHASRGDYTASEDDNVLVQGVSTDKSALAFFGLAYYEENKDKLKLVPIDDKNDENGKGPIMPTLETVSNGTYIPLARPEFIYINKASANRPEVKAFVAFYMEVATELISEVGYIPLPSKAYIYAKSRFDKQITGTLFSKEGSSVGINMVELLADEEPDSTSKKDSVK